MLGAYKACAIRITKASPNEIPKVRGYDNLFKTHAMSKLRKVN